MNTFENDIRNASLWNADPSTWMGLLDTYPHGSTGADEIEHQLVRNDGFVLFAQRTDNEDYIQKLLNRGSVFRFFALMNPNTSPDVLAAYAAMFVVGGTFDIHVSLAIMSNPNTKVDTARSILDSIQPSHFHGTVQDPMFYRTSSGECVLSDRIFAHLSCVENYQRLCFAQKVYLAALPFRNCMTGPSYDGSAIQVTDSRFRLHPDLTHSVRTEPISEEDFPSVLKVQIHEVWNNPNLTASQVALCVDWLVARSRWETMWDNFPRNPLISDNDITRLKKAFPRSTEIQRVYAQRIKESRCEGQVRDSVRKAFAGSLGLREIKAEYAKILNPTEAETDFVKAKFVAQMQIKMSQQHPMLHGVRLWTDPDDPTCAITYVSKDPICNGPAIAFIWFDDNAPKPSYMTDLIPYLDGTRVTDRTPPIDVILRSPISEFLLEIYNIAVLDLLTVD